mmetsp:Transcript_18415/g.39354  ORF Transcript_18415/g.39354 Transcript_18415/m.39354 type:complete len:265 (-) Transcript_18415:298-1092(-)
MTMSIALATSEPSFLERCKMMRMKCVRLPRRCEELEGHLFRPYVEPLPQQPPLLSQQRQQPQPGATEAPAQQQLLQDRCPQLQVISTGSQWWPVDWQHRRLRQLRGFPRPTSTLALPTIFRRLSDLDEVKRQLSSSTTTTMRRMAHHWSLFHLARQQQQQLQYPHRGPLQQHHPRAAKVVQEGGMWLAAPLVQVRRLCRLGRSSVTKLMTLRSRNSYSVPSRVSPRPRVASLFPAQWWQRNPLKKMRSCSGKSGSRLGRRSSAF